MPWVLKGLMIACVLIDLVHDAQAAAAATAAADPRIESFRQAIQEHLPTDAAHPLVSEGQVRGIIAAAAIHLLDADPAAAADGNAAVVNRDLMKQGYALKFHFSMAGDTPMVESISIARFDPANPEPLKTDVFEPLLGPNDYPTLPMFRAVEERVFSRQDGENEWINPGRVVVLEDTPPIVLLFPEAITKQARVFGVPQDLVEEVVRINEAAHVLLDLLIGTSQPDAVIPAMDIVVSERTTIEIVAVTRPQFHELFSDGATLALTTQFPETMAMLWCQVDDQHRPSHRLLVDAVVCALDDWADASEDMAHRAERQRLVAALKPKHEDDLDAPRAIAMALKNDEGMQKHVKAIVTGIFTSVARRVVIDLTDGPPR